MARLLLLLILFTSLSISAQEPPKGLQSISVTGGVFGPLILPGDLGDWELDPVINRYGVINLTYPKNTYKLGYHRQNIFGEGMLAGVYNHKHKINFVIYNYDKGGPMISLSKTFTIFKKK